MSRIVVTRAPHREVGIVNAGWLLDHPVEHESHLERRFIMVALSCPVVIDIKHQPFSIWLGPDDTHRYTPDFLVTFDDGTQLVVEVKAEVFLEQEQAKLDAAKWHLRDMGFPFLTLTDKQIDRQGLGSRAILLMRYGRIAFTAAQALECKQLLQKHCAASASVRELMELGASEEIVWHLVAAHALRVDAGLHMNVSDSVYLNTKEECCDAVFRTWFGIV
ncbi:MAG: TnsA endonuclease N-terminal domain-containing protein [Gammaproteobacteria bacterium]|nr:TnsA endonuclease N-terminal domain-containing protein [Gammaproteobacteria bacterium]MBU1506823.1 TnsA endonuclease N-terminal domain-containing protein [Gammaproteobacteria bacterium]MBU2121976.1 TnsA endonuclease N-terminal domain-containing protein [Gammaproteobacteria bacterium]MBU2202288.1 TnsA endonuclease N-terminal domain-containing protein [Gammaproteobacteria bacterium]MBU2277130.1 TnsA endonuclease N-terminal domain-containing protein [Gammaproteobacteria bacterium]